MGSIQSRAIRNGLVAAAVTAATGFALSGVFTPDGSPSAAGSSTATPLAGCKPRTEPVDRSAVGGLVGRFEGVWLDAPNDGWAVGSTGDPRTAASAVLAHWDGLAWTGSSDVPDTFSVDVLLGVDGSAADDVWAVGWSSDGTGGDALATHFDGSSWEVTDVPGDSALFDVRALAEDDAWAVGSAGDPEIVNEHAIALHWDGSMWTQAALPVGGGRSGLSAVAGGTGDVWAVGYHHRGPLLLHYDGTSWERTLEFDARGPLDDVAVADGAVWLVGSSIVRGDGSRFTEIARAPQGGRFSAIAATAANRAFAVGSVVRDGVSRALAVAVGGEQTAPAHVRAPGNDALDAIALLGGDGWTAGWRESANGIVPLVATLRGC